MCIVGSPCLKNLVTKVIYILNDFAGFGRELLDGNLCIYDIDHDHEKRIEKTKDRNMADKQGRILISHRLGGKIQESIKTAAIGMLIEFFQFHPI